MDMLYHRVSRVWKWLCIVLNSCLFLYFEYLPEVKMQYAGPFGRGVLLHAQAPTHTHTWRKAFRNVINCIILINFDYTFLQLKCMCPFLCCHWFYIEIKTFFFLGSVYKHLRILTGKRDPQMKVQCLPKLCNKKFG